MFASEALGKGIIIIPEDGIVRAPFDAKVVSLFPTNHAICLESETGVELMIHIGIDTVKLNGQYFTAFVAQEDVVKAGDKLVEFNIDGIKNSGYSEQTMVIITNSADFAEFNADTEKETDGTEAVIHLSK